MSVNYRINDPEKYLKMDREFNIYFNELDSLLHSELYADWRSSVDSMLESVENGSVGGSDTQMKEYIEGYKSVVSSLKSGAIKMPYTHLFKYLLLMQYNVVGTDLKKEDMSEFLKLKELSKHVRILPIKQSGGEDDDAMVEFRPVRRGISWKGILVGVMLGLGGAIFTSSVVDTINDTVVSHFETIVPDHEAKFMELVNDKILPSSYTRYTTLYPDGPPEWFEDGLDEGLRSEFKESANEEETKLLALPSPEMVEYAVGAGADTLTPNVLTLIEEGKIEKPEDEPFTALQVYEYERTRTLVSDIVEPKVKSFEEHIADLKKNGLITKDEIVGLVMNKELPPRLRSAVETVGADTIVNFKNALSLVGDRVQSQTVKLADERIRIRAGIKSAKAMESVASEGWIGKLQGFGQLAIASLSGQSPGVQETGTVALTSALSKTREMARDTFNMINTYTDQMAMFFPDHLSGLQRDLGQDFVMLRIGVIIMLLSKFIILFNVFGPDNIVLNMFILPAIWGLISSNPLIALMAAAIANVGYRTLTRGNRGTATIADGRLAIEDAPRGGRRHKSRRRSKNKSSRKRKTKKHGGSKHKKSKSKSSRKHRKPKRKTIRKHRR